MNQIVYSYKNSLYINLTNKCPCACSYCIKRKWDWKFRGHNLKLTHEPSSEEVVEAVKKFISLQEKNGNKKVYNEIVFCGYGEPFMRYDVMKESATLLKKQGFTIRVNTTGLAEASDKKNGKGRSLEALLGGLKGLVDSFSVSMNAADPETYNKVNCPYMTLFPTEDKNIPFYSVIDFVKTAKNMGFDITITAITLPGLDVNAVSEIAAQLGVKFRLREYLDEYEDR